MKIKAFIAAFAATLSLASIAAAQVGNPGSGYDYTNHVWRPLSVNASGSVNVNGSASGSNVYGSDNAGAAQSKPPVVMGGVSINYGSTGGTVYSWHVDSSGLGHVVFDSAQPVTVSGTATVSGTVAATESGTWTVQPGNTANTTPWIIGGNSTASDGAALTTRVTTFDLNSLYNGSTADMWRSISASPANGTGVGAVAIAPNSHAGSAITPVVSSAVESGHVLKASAGNLYRLRVTSTVAGYVLIFNSTTVPSNGAVTPQSCTQAGVGTTEIDHATIPDRYTTGISVAYSTTGCFTNTLSVTAMIEGEIE